VDDVNVHNNDWRDHLNNLKMVFDKLRSINLEFNSGKCCFGTKEITFLRHVVDQQGSKLKLAKYVLSQNSQFFYLLLMFVPLWDSQHITDPSYMDMVGLLHLCLI
jgi:hypothetical protein